MPTRLTLDDPKLFPVQAFFNSIADTSFVQVVDHLTGGIGYSINDAHVRFPADLEQDEQTFDRIRFSLHEDRVTITRNELRKHLQALATNFISQHPEEKNAVEQLLARP